MTNNSCAQVYILSLKCIVIADRETPRKVQILSIFDAAVSPK
jgi:hypothetical protein